MLVFSKNGLKQEKKKQQQLYDKQTKHYIINYTCKHKEKKRMECEYRTAEGKEEEVKKKPIDIDANEMMCIDLI